MIAYLIALVLLVTSATFSHNPLKVKKKESRACISLKDGKACWIAKVSKTRYTRKKEKSLFIFEVSFVQKDRNVLLENHSCDLTLSLFKNTFSCTAELNYSSAKATFTVKVRLEKNDGGSYLTLLPDGKRLNLCSGRPASVFQKIRVSKDEVIEIGFTAVGGKIRAVIEKGNRTYPGRWLNLKDILKC